MDAKTYFIEASGFDTSPLSTVDNKQLAYYRHSIGLIGEINESFVKIYNMPNFFLQNSFDHQQYINEILLELGDVLWYVVRVFDIVSNSETLFERCFSYSSRARIFAEQEHNTHSKMTATIDILVRGECLCDIVKKNSLINLRSSRELQNKLLCSLRDIVESVYVLSCIFGCSIEHIMFLNIEKLKGRIAKLGEHKCLSC